jgi:hypothetical protein
MYIYEVRPRKDKRGADLISDALPFGPNQQRNRLRKIFQPFTRCCDSRLR